VSKVIMAAVMAFCSIGCSGPSDEPITEGELAKRTQELLDGITAGDRRPFELYFAEDSLIHDEKGRSMDKKALVADITPLPPDTSAGIKINSPESRIVGSTAILSYDMDEVETVAGQSMRARYRTTDTWLRRNGVWQIVAEQAMRYYEDPALGRPEITKYSDYIGVYELEPGKTIEVTRDGDALFSQRNGRAKESLLQEAGDLFFRKDVEGRRLFRRDAGGKVDALIDRRNNEDLVWRKTR
jgi:Domain of unknown function (DUF4440)/Domain of unknown function (DUF3471)